MSLLTSQMKRPDGKQDDKKLSPTPLIGPPACHQRDFGFRNEVSTFYNPQSFAAYQHPIAHTGATVQQLDEHTRQHSPQAPAPDLREDLVPMRINCTGRCCE